MLITQIAVFFVILSVLVLVHELGHFLSAKRFGIKVEEFGFGLPPRLWGKKIGETVYSINCLPIGGFVKLFGEDREEEPDTVKSKRKKTGRSGRNEEKRAFYYKPVWQRITVLTSGVAMNFFLGVAIITFIFTQGVMVPTSRVHLEKVLINTPASTAGLEEGDVIRKMIYENSIQNIKEEVEITRVDEVSDFTKKHLGEEIYLVIDRQSEELLLPIVPDKTREHEGPMGVVISNYEEKIYPWYQAPVYGIKESMVLTYEHLKGIGITLWKLISFQAVSEDVVGPIGIAKLTGEAVKFGRLAVLELMGIISLNLAIVNLLPFPALDGGRLVFTMIEGTTGRKVKASIERTLHQIGMVILLALLFLVTVNDLLRIFGPK